MSSLHTSLCICFPFFCGVHWKTVRVSLMLLDRVPAISSSASHFDELCQGIEADKQTDRERMAFPSPPKYFKRKLILRQTNTLFLICYLITHYDTLFLICPLFHSAFLIFVWWNTKLICFIKLNLNWHKNFNYSVKMV